MPEAAVAGKHLPSVRGLLRPLVGYFDHRFDDVHQRLERIEAGLAGVRDDLAALRRTVELDAETTIELHHAVERSLAALVDELRGEGR